MVRCPAHRRLPTKERLGQLPHQHGRCLEVDSLVLEGHGERPEGAVSEDRRMSVGKPRMSLDELPHRRVHLLTVLVDLLHVRPVDRGTRQVVPAHLIDSRLK